MNNKGFSLIELFIVVVIISGLAFWTIPAYMKYVHRLRAERTTVEISAESYAQVAKWKVEYPKELRETLTAALTDSEISVEEFEGIQVEYDTIKKLEAMKIITKRN